MIGTSKEKLVMPSHLVVIKKDGTQTRPMMQAQAQTYLGQVINDLKSANLKQSLNQAFDGNGKATGSYLYQAREVLHASSGKAGTDKCVTLFYYVASDMIYLIAMGKHVSSSSYTLNFYGQPDAPWKKDSQIALR